MAQRTLDDVTSEIVELSAEIDTIEEKHRRRRALYLEAKDGGMSNAAIAELAHCTKEAVTLQLRRARSEAGRD